MRRILVSAIVLVLAGVSISVAAPTADATADAPMPGSAELATTQLPRTVRPSHYDVSIVPHAGALNFDGSVKVAIDVLEPTRRITLNAIDLTFARVSLTGGDGDGMDKFAAPKVQVDAQAQTATFTFARPVPPGSYQLAMDYTGKIGTQANGLFAIDYESAAGKKRALYTQFENSDARRLIPCWDEPAYKASFTLSATVPSEQLAVSNMPVAQREVLGHGLTRVRFAPSPKMSTYLLFFGLGDFERATADVEGTELGVVTQKGALAQAAFALDSAKSILREYNDYFATPYPLPKLDNIASPGSSQFFGAMENWGAIFTFESVLLLDPSISTQADKQFVFSVAAHEMAHQWFGNLVTMRWWDDLWLNEGFASWMEGRTTQKLHPEWNTALSSVEVREAAMSRDAVATTHPVVQHVETVEQASQAFDSITYSKGEAVIGMLEAYVGADAWREGVRRYMKAHAYGNTVSDDLWREVEKAAGTPVLEIAHQFTLQPGVPMIRVERATCAAGNTTVELVQAEFTKDRPDKRPLSWRVPVIASTLGNDARVRTLVSNGRATMTVPGCGPLILNPGQSGYYRTLYSPAQFSAIRNHFAQLAPIDQLGLMKDALAQGLAGLQPASDYLGLVRATPVDADPQVWGEIAGGLYGLSEYYEGDAARQGRFRAFAIARLSPVFAKVGWTAQAGEASPVTILRSDLIRTLGALGDPAVVAEVRRRHAAQASDPGAVPTALRKAILAVLARHADAKTWDQLHVAAKAEKTPLVRDEFYSLLSQAEDARLAQRALELALTDEPGATNSAGMVAAVANSHPDLAFDFAVAHLARLDQRVDSTSRSRYYPSLGSNSLEARMIGKIKLYSTAHIAAGSRRSADTVIANITYRIKVRKERLPAIDAWLQSNGG